MDSNAKTFKINSQIPLEAKGHNKQEKKILYRVHETVGNFCLGQSGNFQLPAGDSNLSLKGLNLYK